MTVILTCCEKFTHRKSPIVIEVLNLMHFCYSLTSLEIIIVLLARCVNLVLRMGDEERKNHLHHISETAPIDASLAICVDSVFPRLKEVTCPYNQYYALPRPWHPLSVGSHTS